MTYEQLLEEARRMEAERSANENVFMTDCRMIAFLLDHCRIDVPEASEYFVHTNVGKDAKRIRRVIMVERREIIKREDLPEEKRIGRIARAFYGSEDFGHTAPSWDRIMALGIRGMKRAILDRTGPARDPRFVEGETMVLEAAERFLLRAADAAQTAGKSRMAQGIRNLAANPPANLFEGFQMTLLYYTLQQFFDGTDVRTMGRLDQLLQPFYGAEPDKAEAYQLALLYMREIDALKAAANMPFALAGTDGNGVSQVNEMSYVLLQAYRETKLPNTKLHILCNEDMPRDFLRLAMTCVKEGGNSLVFINNRLMVEGLVKLGLRRDDAAAYAIVGCYEASGRDEIPCSCAGRLGLPKALEVTLHGGMDLKSGAILGHRRPVDFETFEDLMGAFLANLEKFVQGSMELISGFERNYPRFMASPFFSACMASTVKNGADAYTGFGAAYNNSSINLIGLATVTDSLYAIRKLVYEEKRLTLRRFVEILDSNWEGQEVLRGIIRNKLPKYGTGNRDVDALACRIFDFLSDHINNVPNAKGGVYRMGVMSIDWRKAWGEYCLASADGRMDGETLSQNASATFGMDREGPTGHILSAAALQGVNAVNGSVLDLDLHSSLVRGENGTEVLMATLDAFLEAGGQTVHYNVLDTAALRDAQAHPENYPNLQVRMCGWNVLFTHMSEKSQNEFISRSEMLAC